MISEVLISQGVSGLPGPYIPTFYLDKDLRLCSSEASKVRIRQDPIMQYIFIKFCITVLQNALMQQPLAHLYFIAVFEQLQTKMHTANFFVRLASKIDEVRIILHVDTSSLVTKGS